MRNRFLPQVEDRLRVAGWYPGRRVAEEELERMDEEKPLFLYAQRAIEEFAGLYVEAHLGKRSFCIDPSVVMDEEDLREYEKVMKRRLYPLGLIDYSIDDGVSGEDVLFIDQYGCVYAYQSQHLSIMLVGLSIDEALNNLGMERGYRWWDFANDCQFESSSLLTKPEESIPMQGRRKIR